VNVDWDDRREDLPQYDESGGQVGWVKVRMLVGTTSSPDGRRLSRFYSIPLYAPEPVVGLVKTMIVDELATRLRNEGGDDDVRAA